MDCPVKSKILVCCHKHDICAHEEPYFPIQVGKALSSVDLGIQGDDIGDNISIKNESYCELTGLYWAWKNLSDADVVGLCHYRRYFDFHNQCKKILPYTNFQTGSIDRVDLSIPDAILKKIAAGTIVVARPRNYRYNLMVNYCLCHNSDDFFILENVINETQPIVIKNAFRKIFYCTKDLSHFNMFLMPYCSFQEYCEWLFPLLQNVESRIDITHYNKIQKRIYGYMAERLLNVWLETRKEKIMKMPVIWFNEGRDVLERYSPFKYYIHRLINNIPDFLFNERNLDFDR